MCGTKYPFSNLTVHPLKFGNGYVISSHTSLCMWLFIHDGDKVDPPLCANTRLLHMYVEKPHVRTQGWINWGSTAWKWIPGDFSVMSDCLGGQDNAFWSGPLTHSTVTFFSAINTSVGWCAPSPKSFKAIKQWNCFVLTKRQARLSACWNRVQVPRQRDTVSNISKYRKTHQES